MRRIENALILISLTGYFGRINMDFSLFCKLDAMIVWIFIYIIAMSSVTRRWGTHNFALHDAIYPSFCTNHQKLFYRPPPEFLWPCWTWKKHNSSWTKKKVWQGALLSFSTSQLFLLASSHDTTGMSRIDAKSPKISVYRVNNKFLEYECSVVWRLNRREWIRIHSRLTYIRS